MWEPCNCPCLVWSPLPYMECGNLVIINDSDGLSIPDMEGWILLTVNNFWYPIPYMECGNFVTVNDLYCPPICYMECGNLINVNDYYGTPITCMELGNLVTVNDL